MFRALRHRNYRLFFAGQVISLTGTWMQSVAQAWLVYRLTGSATLLGLVSFASQLPVFLFSPFGGAAADRYDRRGILIGTQVGALIASATLAVLTLSGALELWHLFALASLTGVVNAIDIPTRQSFVVEMVGRDDLVNAIALNSSIFNTARAVGPAVAGVLVASVGEGWCFLINAVSYLAVIAGLLAMRVSRREPVSMAASTLARVTEGFTYVARTAPIRALLLLLGVISFAGMGYAVLMPVFANQILGGDAASLGLLTGASGVGALLGALVLAARSGIRGLGRWVAAAALGLGLLLILFSLSRSFWLSVALLVPIGFCMILTMASSNTLVQSMVPDQLRGRVMAVYSMMFMGVAPFGALAAGAVAERFGASVAVALGGAVCTLAASLFGSRLSGLRGQARELILAQQMAAGEPAEVASPQP